MSKPKIPNCPCAVIMTAIPLEFQAAIRHVHSSKEVQHKSGTLYHEGIFTGKENTWRVGVALTGMGNISAGISTERAITQFDPDVMIFVGIAGGIKDVKPGDIVIAEKSYDYESGKVGSKTVFYRPHIGLSSSAIYQRAFKESLNDDWRLRIVTPRATLSPKVILKPIVTGEKVITSTDSELFTDIRVHFNDAIAVEMESGGFLTAAHMNDGIQALIVRGISDLIDNKTELDQQGYQEIAADHASAFAFEVLSKFRF
jgi:5'-methylthioadenosine/S-adenosylhomocysteine nucleosidase